MVAVDVEAAVIVLNRLVIRVMVPVEVEAALIRFPTLLIFAATLVETAVIVRRNVLILLTVAVEEGVALMGFPTRFVVRAIDVEAAVIVLNRCATRDIVLVEVEAAVICFPTLLIFAAVLVETAVIVRRNVLILLATAVDVDVASIVTCFMTCLVIVATDVDVAVIVRRNVFILLTTAAEEGVALIGFPTRFVTRAVDVTTVVVSAWGYWKVSVPLNSKKGLLAAVPTSSSAQSEAELSPKLKLELVDVPPAADIVYPISRTRRSPALQVTEVSASPSAILRFVKETANSLVGPY